MAENPNNLVLTEEAVLKQARELTPGEGSKSGQTVSNEASARQSQTTWSDFSLEITDSSSPNVLDARSDVAGTGNDRFRMVRAGEKYDGLWSILDMDALTVATIDRRPLEGLDESFARTVLERLRAAEAAGRL